MEFSEAGEYRRRPELNPKQPSQLFSYAKEMQRYLKERVSEHQLPESIDYVVEDLENVISQFPSLPELTIVSRDVYETTRLIQSKDGVYIIKTGPKPLDGDAALYGEHSFIGTLYGFHRGVNNDLRAYVSKNETQQMLMGGIYTPLLSVGIEDSEIELTNISAQEQLDERGHYVSTLLSEYDDVVSDYMRQIIEVLNSTHDPIVARLQHVSPLLVQAAQHKETSQQFVDAVTDIIMLKLGLNVPQDIHTRQHRVVITEKPIPSYKLEELGMFTNITPQLGLLGESAKRELGLFFLQDERAIQVPVKNITYIHRTQPE